MSLADCPPRDRVRPVRVLQWAFVRLRPLTEAECYARCYGGRREEFVSVLRLPPVEEAASADPNEPFEGPDAAEGREAA